MLSNMIAVYNFMLLKRKLIRSTVFNPSINMRTSTID